MVGESRSVRALFHPSFDLPSTPTGCTPPQAGVGYIPAQHGRTGRTSARGLICLGDSAAGQSLLTFCGFGSFVRHIGRVSHLLHYALDHDLLEEKHLRMISPHQANLRVAWVFSRFMQSHRDGDPASVNRLMNIFCRALGEIGPGATRRFLQDRFTLAEYIRIMLSTARLYPGVVPFTACVLGLKGLASWAGDIAYFGADSVLQRLFSAVGASRWRRLERVVRRVSPGLASRLISLRTAWHALN